MTEQTKNPPETRRICGDSIKYAKLEKDGAIAASNVRSDTQAPVSECSQEIAHPRVADDCRRAPAHHQLMEVAEMVNNENGHGFDGAPVLAEALGMALEVAPKKMLQVDIAKYQAWLDDPDLSEENKEQIIRSIWQIVMCFVDLGFGVVPLQDACGQVPEGEGFCGTAKQVVVKSKAHTLSEKFNLIAGS